MEDGYCRTTCRLDHKLIFGMAIDAHNAFSNCTPQYNSPASHYDTPVWRLTVYHGRECDCVYGTKQTSIKASSVPTVEPQYKEIHKLSM